MASNLFIALGGTGFKVVSRLQELNDDLYKNGSVTGGLTEKDPNYYVYLDTDQVSTDFASNTQGNTTVLDLGPFKPSSYFRTNEQKAEVNSWFDTENITMPPNDLKAGAKGIRQLVRMGYYYEPNCNNHLVALLNQFHYKSKNAILENENNLDNLKVYVVSGSAGGTGSGIFIDVIYTIWRFFIEQGYNGNMNVKAIILMPNSFLKVNDPDLKLKYKMNGYAFMNEVNALVKFGLSNLNDQFHTFVPKKYNHPANQNWQPLTAGVLVDDVNDKFAFNQAYLYETITEFLYTYTFGKEILGTTSKTVNNVTKTIESLLDSALTNSETNRNLKQVDFFNSFGLLVVQSATAEHFPEYTALRFKMDVLEYLIGTSSETIGSTETIEQLYTDLISKLGKIYKEFEDQSFLSFQTPKLNKTEKADFIRILKLLNFNGTISKANGPGLESAIAAIVQIQGKLRHVCEEGNRIISEFIKHQFIMGVSLMDLQNAIKKLDDTYYSNYSEEHKQNLEGKKDDEILKDAGLILKSRAKEYYYYKLSKGSELGNNSGYLDNAIRYIESISKEIEELIADINKNQYEPFLDQVFSLKENGAKSIVPPVETLVTTRMNKRVVNPQGALVKWYDQLHIDKKEQCKVLLESIFGDKEYSGYFNQGQFDAKKFNKATILHLDDVMVNFRSNSDAYIARMAKSLLEIISEEDCDNALNHLMAFDYPFIKLTTPHTVSKKVFAGYGIDNNHPVMKKIGYDPNQFNDILLDNIQFKHKIVKIVFFHKLSFSDYFNFDNLSSVFKEKFTDIKSNKGIISSPFIHKDLAGQRFDGDVFSVISNASKTILAETFDELSDDKKQLILKYGLIYFTQYVKAAKAAGVLQINFKEDIVQYDSSLKKITYLLVAYDEFLGDYAITNGSDTCLITNSVSVQGHKPKVIGLFDFLKSNMVENSKLDDAAVINCHRESYLLIKNELDSKLLGEVLSDFVDLKSRRIKSDFIEYFITVMS